MTDSRPVSMVSAVSADESFKEFRDNGLILHPDPDSNIDLADLENVHDYDHGGHHPIHLGNLLAERFKVLHKLGTGVLGNVWLCRDTQAEDGLKYVAIKVLRADASSKDSPELRVERLAELGLGQDVMAENFCVPLMEKIVFEGPNGTHYGMVYPVLGQPVSKLHSRSEQERDVAGKLKRKVCARVTMVMALLHAHGVCHGDFRPENILTRIDGLDGRPEEEVQRILGAPSTIPVHTRGGDLHSLPTAPRDLVTPINWKQVHQQPNTNLLTSTPCVIDWGESFLISDPPEDLGIPLLYSAPAYVLDKKAGEATDLWALGCALFEIRTGGTPLFGGLDDDDPDAYLAAVVGFFGKLPETWWMTTWEGRGRYYEEDGVPVETPAVREFIGSMPGSIEEAVVKGLVSTESDSRGVSVEKEATLFADLLRKIMTYTPGISAMEALNHDWFAFEE